MEVTLDMRRWARDNDVTVDLVAATEQMLDAHRAKGNLFEDWQAAWRTWMRNTKRYGGPQPQPQPAPTTPTAPTGGGGWSFMHGQGGAQ